MGVVSENILFHIFERAITRYAYSRKLPYLVQQGDVFKLSIIAGLGVIAEEYRSRL
jgi:hypothetical protein